MNTEKILLVDDERAIRLAVRTALTREGMQVTEAADGSEALELLKKQQFHLVILDVMMEHVGGYDVLQAMRAADGAAALKRHGDSHISHVTVL